MILRCKRPSESFQTASLLMCALFILFCGFVFFLNRNRLLRGCIGGGLGGIGGRCGFGSGLALGLCCLGLLHRGVLLGHRLLFGGDFAFEAVV